jgi:hypothetical protein
MKIVKILLFVLLPIFLGAQRPNAPTRLTASYREYPSQIELSWLPVTGCVGYKIYRHEKNQPKFELLDSVRGTIHSDRNNLKVQPEYVYQVRAIAADGALSAGSQEAIGALLLVAKPDSPLVRDALTCLQLEITDATATATLFVAKFKVVSNCTKLKSVQLTLYRSDDDVLDEKDVFLIQEPAFDMSLPRGVLVQKNQGKPSKGYLLLRIEANGESVTVVRKIK